MFTADDPVDNATRILTQHHLARFRPEHIPTAEEVLAPYPMPVHEPETYSMEQFFRDLDRGSYGDNQMPEQDRFSGMINESDAFTNRSSIMQQLIRTILGR